MPVVDAGAGLAVSASVTIPEAEIEFTAIRSQGAGGQNVNKVASAVQLRFDAAGSSALPDGCRQRLLALRDHRISAAAKVSRDATRSTSTPGSTAVVRTEKPGAPNSKLI